MLYTFLAFYTNSLCLCEKPEYRLLVKTRKQRLRDFKNNRSAICVSPKAIFKESFRFLISLIPLITSYQHIKERVNLIALKYELYTLLMIWLIMKSIYLQNYHL